MKQPTTDLSMQLISIAGESKAMALMAIKKAKTRDFVKAGQLILQASEKLTEVHLVHAEIIATEASGQEYDINTLYLHAQDHFSSALVINDLAGHIVDLYQLVDTNKQ